MSILNTKLRQYAEFTQNTYCDKILKDVLTLTEQDALLEGNKVSIIQILCNLDKVEEAEYFLKRNKDLVRLGAYLPILYSFMKQQNTVKILKLYDEIINKNIKLKYENYFDLLKYLSTQNEKQAFNTVIDTMEYLGIVPNKNTWNLICNHYNAHRFLPNKNNRCPHCKSSLKVIDCDNTRFKICNTLEKHIINHRVWIQFKEQLNKNKYSYIIDGANIGRFDNHGKLNIDYKKILLVTKKLGNSCLVVLHYRHTDVIKKLIENKVSVQIVPKGHDDDWFSLYGALYLNCFFVSNDQARNHGYANNCQKELQWWMTHHSVSLRLSGEQNYEVIFPPKYSTCIQYYSSNGIHIPSSENSEWLCVTL